MLDLFIRPSHSIVKQSYGARERLGDGLSGLPSLLNADGFGVAWYAPEESGDPTPGCYVSTAPAWNDANLPRLCAKLSSHLVLAHIRAASLGAAVTLPNCHPFISGRYALQHNGHIGCFAALKRRILATLSDRALASVRGTTDSEHLFALFLTEVEAEEARLAGSVTRTRASDGGPAAPLPPEALQRCLLRTFQRLQRFRREAGVAANCLLNVCVTDGHTLLCTRVVLGEGAPASLYVTVGSEWLPAAQAVVGEGGASATSHGSCTSAPSDERAGIAMASLHAHILADSAASGSFLSSHVYRRPRRGPSEAAGAVGPAEKSSSSSLSSSSGIGCPGVAFEMRSRDVRPRCVIVASERLTAREEDWLTVPPASMLVIHRGAGSLAVTRIAMPPQLMDAEPLPLPMPLLSPSLYGTPAPSEAAAAGTSAVVVASSDTSASPPESRHIVEKLSLQPIPAGGMSLSSETGTSAGGTSAGAALPLPAFALGEAHKTDCDASGSAVVRSMLGEVSASPVTHMSAQQAQYRPPVYLRRRRPATDPCTGPKASSSDGTDGIDDSDSHVSVIPLAKRARPSTESENGSSIDPSGSDVGGADTGKVAIAASAVRAQLACLGRNLPSHLGLSSNALLRASGASVAIVAGSHDGGAAGTDDDHHDVHHHRGPHDSDTHEEEGAVGGSAPGAACSSRLSQVNSEGQQSLTFRFSGAESLAQLLRDSSQADCKTGSRDRERVRSDFGQPLLERRGAALTHLDAVVHATGSGAEALLPKPPVAAHLDVPAGAEPSPAALLAQGRHLFSSTPQTLLTLNLK